MSRHSFDPLVATQVGINAAVIYQNLLFWIEKNEANDHNLKDGRYWTYNSIAAFAKLFPYFTEKQIRTAIDKLLNAGLILKGNYSQDRYDRTAWYALNLPICPSGKIDPPIRDDDAFAQKGERPAPAGKSLRNRYNPDKKPLVAPAGAQEAADDDFEKIWAAFPEDRRRGKPACIEHFRAAVAASFHPDEIRDAVQTYAQDTAGFTRSKVSFSDNWFRQERWRERVEVRRAQHALAEAEAGASLEAQCERLTGWVKNRSALCRHITKTQVEVLLARGVVTEAELAAVGVRL